MGNKRQSQERIRIVYGPQFSQGGHAWLESLLYNWLSWLKFKGSGMTEAHLLLHFLLFDKDRGAERKASTEPPNSY